MSYLMIHHFKSDWLLIGGYFDNSWAFWLNFQPRKGLILVPYSAGKKTIEMTADARTVHFINM